MCSSDLELQTLDEFLNNNPSFCIYPWINWAEENGKLSLCVRADKKITTPDRVTDWKNNADFAVFRQKMLAGERLPDHCSTCYQYEDLGIESYRQFETKEWVTKLGITNVNDLDHIDRPYYYELRLSNKCNLMCRGCQPEFSHLIDRKSTRLNSSH